MLWWRQLTPDEIYLSAITIQELRLGIEILPVGSRRQGLERWLDEKVLGTFAGRILPVDIAVAEACARLSARAKRAGRVPELGDALIAATASVHNLTVATLNRKHFEPLGCKLVSF